MKKSILFVPFLALFMVNQAGICQDSLIREITTSQGLTGIHLENALISVVVYPQATGIATDFFEKSTACRFTEPLGFVVEKVELLPTICTHNDTGARGALWGRTISTQEMLLSEQSAVNGKVSVVVHNRFYQGLTVEYNRRYSLRDGQAILAVEMTCTNTGQRPMEIGLWENFLGRINSDCQDDTLIIPVKGGISAVGKIRVRNFTRDGRYFKSRANDRNELFAAPSQLWIARYKPGRPLLVLRGSSGLGKQGFLYNWCGQNNGFSSELVHEMVKLEPSEQTSMRVDYLFFSKLDRLSTLCGDVAIDHKISDNEIIIRIATAKPLDVGTMELPGIGKAPIGWLEPGEVKKIVFPRPPQITPEQTVSGQLSAIGSFELLPEITR
jgi:hypothetical protein